MRGQRHFSASCVVLTYPSEQKIQALILLLFGSVLVRLPGSRTAVLEALSLAGIQKYKPRSKSQRYLHEIRVTAFDHPGRVCGTECAYIVLGLLRRSRDCDRVWRPSHRVEVQQSGAGTIGQPSSQRRFPGSRISNDGDAHAFGWSRRQLAGLGPAINETSCDASAPRLILRRKVSPTDFWMAALKVSALAPSTTIPSISRIISPGERPKCGSGEQNESRPAIHETPTY